MTALWMDNGGRIACIEHGGAYLRAEIEQRPRARRIDTPITARYKISKTDATAIEKYDGEIVVCETCDSA